MRDEEILIQRSAGHAAVVELHQLLDLHVERDDVRAVFGKLSRPLRSSSKPVRTDTGIVSRTYARFPTRFAEP